MVVSFGYSAWSLGTGRGEETGYRTLISGFGMVGRVLGLRLYVLLLTFLWYLAVAVPAAVVVALLSLVLMFAGAYVGPDGVTYLSGWAAVAITVAAVVVCVAAIALLVRILLRYALCDYALLDAPEAGALAAVRRSKELMMGRKWEYFKLQLSFLGWWVLVYLLMLLPMLVWAVWSVAAAALTSSAAAAGMLTGMMAGMVAASLLMFLLPLPLECWLMPYVGLTCAGYYNRLVGMEGAEPKGSAPGTPPWEYPAL